MSIMPVYRCDAACPTWPQPLARLSVRSIHDLAIRKTGRHASYGQLLRAFANLNWLVTRDCHRFNFWCASFRTSPNPIKSMLVCLEHELVRVLGS